MKDILIGIVLSGWLLVISLLGVYKNFLHPNRTLDQAKDAPLYPLLNYDIEPKRKAIIRQLRVMGCLSIVISLVSVAFFLYYTFLLIKQLT